jgi:hypothetical protein
MKAFAERAARPLAALLVLTLAGCLSSGQSTAGPDQTELAQRGANPAGALANFHRALAALQAGRQERVTILQIGDSHTAGDHFSNGLREKFQGQFGNAGRGMLPPGSPFPYYRPYQVKVAQSGNWEVLSSNRTDYQQLPYGISGYALRSRGANDTLTLTADSDAAFDWVEVAFFRQQGGGKIDLTADGRYLGEIDTRGPAWQFDHKAMGAPAGSTSLELRVRGSVTLADWSIYKRQRGVVVSNHGFVGAQINIMDRWDQTNVANELRLMNPALIVLAFGTNEGFDSVDSLGNYASVFDARLALLRQALPSASIVVVGPPDANRLPDYCGIRGPARERVGCRPLSQTEAANYSSMLARRDRALCRYHTPAGIDIVRQAQQQAAARNGALFWDWSSVQGGACGASNWVPQELGRQDRVHMFESGYYLSADKLHQELMRGSRGR